MTTIFCNYNDRDASSGCPILRSFERQLLLFVRNFKRCFGLNYPVKLSVVQEHKMSMSTF